MEHDFNSRDHEDCHSLQDCKNCGMTVASANRHGVRPSWTIIILKVFPDCNAVLVNQVMIS